MSQITNQKKFCIINVIKMESKDELKEIDIENRTCNYCEDIMRVIDINFINTFLS